MALKDLLKLLSKDESEFVERFERKPVNTTKLRENAAARLKKGRDQITVHTEGEKGPKGHRIWTEQNGVYKVTLPVPINGKHQISRERDETLLIIDQLSEAITAGELDDALVAEAAGGEPAQAKPKAGGKGSRRPLSPEVRAAAVAKRAATRAANRAKAAGAGSA